MFPFLQIKQENKLLRKALQTSFKPKGVSCATNYDFNLTPFTLNLLPKRRQI